MARIAMAVLPGPTKESTPARMQCSTALLHPQRPTNLCNPCHKPRLQRESGCHMHRSRQKTNTSISEHPQHLPQYKKATPKTSTRSRRVVRWLLSCHPPTLTVAAMKAAFKLLPFETQEALVPTNIELCVSYEGEHKLYVNAFRSFIDKPFKEQTQTAQEQHRLQQQRGSKRRQRVTQLQQRRLQRQAQTSPTPMTSTTTTTPASTTTPTSTPTYSNNLTQSWH